MMKAVEVVASSGLPVIKRPSTAELYSMPAFPDAAQRQRPQWISQFEESGSTLPRLLPPKRRRRRLKKKPPPPPPKRKQKSSVSAPALLSCAKIYDGSRALPTCSSSSSFAPPDRDYWDKLMHPWQRAAMKKKKKKTTTTTTTKTAVRQKPQQVASAWDWAEWAPSDAVPWGVRPVAESKHAEDEDDDMWWPDEAQQQQSDQSAVQQQQQQQQSDQSAVQQQQLQQQQQSDQSAVQQQQLQQQQSDQRAACREFANFATALHRETERQRAAFCCSSSSPPQRATDGAPSHHHHHHHHHPVAPLVVE